MASDVAKHDVKEYVYWVVARPRELRAETPSTNRGWGLFVCTLAKLGWPRLPNWPLQLTAPPPLPRRSRKRVWVPQLSGRTLGA